VSRARGQSRRGSAASTREPGGRRPSRTAGAGCGHYHATVPHTLVVAPCLVVDKVYVGYWFWGRPSPFQLWEDLQNLLRRSKDDFDPTTEQPGRPGWQPTWPS
jgi:hypothetical protein